MRRFALTDPSNWMEPALKACLDQRNLPELWSLQNWFALLAIVFVGTMVDWPTVITDLGGSFLPILAGIVVLVPVAMVTALRWKLLIGTETPRHFSFRTAFRGWCLGWFVNLLMPGLVDGDVARATRASGPKSNIRGLFLSYPPSG